MFTKLLDILKLKGCPSTDTGEDEKVIVDKSLNNIAKLQRMKLEVQFARECTTLLPKADSIFKIQVTLPTGKKDDIYNTGVWRLCRGLHGKEE